MRDAAVVSVEMCESPYLIDGLPDRVFLHTELGGRNMPWVVQAALARCRCWNSETALTQLVLTEILQQRVLKTGATERTVSEGIGIATYPVETNYPIIVLNCEEEHVRFEAEDGKIRQVWSFEEFATEPYRNLFEAWMPQGYDRLTIPKVLTPFSCILTRKHTA